MKNLPQTVLLMVVVFIALSTNQYGPVTQTSAIFPLDIAGGFARGAIGRIREIKQGIRSRIRQRMCEVLRHGRVYSEPCEQLQKKPGGGKVVKEEITIEEYEQPKPNYGRGSGGGSYGRPPKKEVTVEETYYDTQASNNKPIYKDRAPGPGRGNNRPKPKQDSSEEDEDDKDYNVKPEKVAEDMEDEEDFSNKKPPPRRPLPGRRPSGDKQGRQTGGGQRPKPRPAKPDQGEPCQTTEGIAGLCMPATYCYSQYSNIEDYRANICKFEESLGLTGGSGICCPREEPVLDAFGK